MDDPLWHTAQVAAHMDGVDGSTALVDLKGNAFAAAGNARITTADSVFGGSCALFDGAGSYFRSNSAIPGLIFLYEPWHVAFWIKTVANNRVLLDFDDTYQNLLFQVKINAAGAIEIVKASATWLTGSVAVNDGGWHYVACGKLGLFPSRQYAYCAVDGALSGALVESSDAFASTGVRLAIGAQVRYRDAAKDFIGKLDDLTIHVGPSGAFKAFNVPSAPFGEAFGDVVAALTTGTLSTSIGGPMPDMSPVLLSSCRPLVDLENGGRGRVIGTTKNVGSPDYPVSRKVRLLRKRDGFLAREVWSDAGGNYLFEHVRHDVDYIVLSHDHTGVYNAVIADSVTPDLMP